jgi:flagellar motor switch protein FliN/FliY
MENTNNNKTEINNNEEMAEAMAVSDELLSSSNDSVEIQNAAFQPLSTSPLSNDKSRKIDLLYDLSLPVSIELGRTNMLIKEILDLQRGSIVEFEKLASEPVDILVNGKKMAEGEVVIIEKHFGIRITNLVETTERVKGLGK